MCVKFVKNAKKKNILLLSKLTGLFVVLFILVKVYLAFIDKSKVLIECDFDDFKKSETNLVFSTSNILHKIKLNNGFLGEISFSGKNSLKVNGHEFVNLIELHNIGPDEVYKITILRNTGSAGVVIQEVTPDKPSVYRFQTFICDTLQDGWGKLEAQIRTPPDYSGNNLKIYIWNPKKELSYFDDLKIEQLEYMTYPEFDEQNAICFYIEDLEFEKLKKIRERAFDKGILITEDDSYVKSIMAFDDKLFETEVRFKGDWLDHLEGDKWSFIVKLSDGSWKNLCTFSLHTPFSRSFINEWLIHKIFQDNDILATRYDFVPVKLNNRSLGIYAYEEHFVKQVLEGQLRREAPIISFSEDDLWNRRSIDLKSKESFIFRSSVIKPFQQNKIIKNDALYHKFIIAQNLLDSFREGELSASEVFYVKQLAKFFALQTVFGAYHGAVWHNLRFYYNPVTCKLEPIAYDCYANYGIFTWGFTNIIGNFSINKSSTHPVHASFYMNLLNDTCFTNEYIGFLKNYVEVDITQKYLDKYGNEIRERESLLKHEFLNYKFDDSELINHLQLISQELDTFSNNLSISTYRDSLYEKTKFIRTQTNYDDNKQYFNDYVKFYKNKPEQISVSIAHKDNITIIGFGNEKEIKVSSNIEVQNTNNQNTFKTNLSISSEQFKQDYIYYRNPIHDTIYKSKVIQWPAPTTYNPRNDIANNATDISSFINHEKREVRFNGNISFNNHVYTPIGYTVIIEAGTNIDITNNSAFIINSNIIAKGTLNNPIKIYSSDKTANGFTILQAEKKSILEYTYFDNLNTLDYNYWTLTGAVTFYEADVEFYNCQFTNNHCEDMLNTIRCDFYLENCLIENTYGDSHDSDFCTGTLKKCTFKNNGNDAIDFSTSIATIEGCNIIGAEDKGISVGENTQATIKDVNISAVNIGIASKDLSHADVVNCDINEAKYGFLLLQKKPEFGPATITAEDCTLTNVWTESLIERYSTLILNGKTYKGKKEKLKALFYE